MFRHWAAWLCCLGTVFCADCVIGAPPVTEPIAYPTFHCIGLYWSPPGGTRERDVLVRFREKGSAEWRAGLPMRYNPIDDTDEDLADYRGSIVHLQPNTTYEIELTLEGTNRSTRCECTTWNEHFPEGKTVRVTSRSEPLVIDESGSPDAWRVYDGRGAVIDVKHRHDACITIDASYVIVRGFTLKGAGSESNKSGSPIGAVRIDGGHDIVIEDCDISDWGRLDPERGFGFNMDSAILSRSSTLSRLIVQRCRMHHPTYDGSTWYEPVHPTHTRGPQCISLFNTAGNHVIRYNECFSDLEHMYNDVIGGGSNASYRGSPSHDSDIYGNFIGYCWDDGLEIEGSNRNVRVWNNYIYQSMMMIGNAASSIGPLYIWNNVVERSQSQPEAGGGNFLKMGYAHGEEWIRGYTYVFHNTMFRGDGWLPTGGLGGNRIVKHTISRNNILEVRSPEGRSLSEAPQNTNNDYDYDLYNGRIPDGAEPHGIRGVPVYEPGAGFDRDTMTGKFRLSPTSLGVAAGEAIPNFSPQGVSKPDIGAHQRGAPPMRFGISAASP